MQLNSVERQALTHPRPFSYRLLVVDDHPVFREGLQLSLQRHLPQVQVALACGRDEALSDLLAHAYTDMVIADQRLAERRPGGFGIVAQAVTGLDLLIELGRLLPAVTRVLISGSDDASLVHRAAQAGCAGYLHKSLPAATCAHAIERMLAGELWFDNQAQLMTQQSAQTGLTLRQTEVLQLLAQGLSNKEMARMLQVGERTIKAHLTAIFEATGSSSRTQALLESGRRGWVRVNEDASSR